jgi:hypothetical protein
MHYYHAFPKSKHQAMLLTIRNITVLSLLSNFIGYTVNLFGLLLLVLAPHWMPSILWGISNENWWLLAFTAFTLPISALTFLSPSGIEAPLVTQETQELIPTQPETKSFAKRVCHKITI